MDYTMVRLKKEVSIGTEVELIGDHVSANGLADLSGTNVYHVFCQLSDRIPRKYLRGGAIVETIFKRYPMLQGED